MQNTGKYSGQGNQEDMKHSLKNWNLLLTAKKLEEIASTCDFVLNETGTRYSIEVNFRTTVPDIIEHYSKLILGYVMSGLKQHNYFVKHVYTQKPYRILVSTRQWDDGEWVGIVSFNEDKSCFVFTPGVYSKSRGTASYKPEESKKCAGTSAAEITREVLNQMEDLKKKPLRDGERLKPAHKKRGPNK